MALRVDVKQTDTYNARPVFLSHHAGVAQLVEQLICNQQVAGSIPIAG